ncbi:uncharacterized protein LOC108905712 [Anoplophora glabripennis]|nr:uncharacterized protein LOC108905712 [Anoplophora glabripennis]XP_018564212.1 uncharacterized protein LOC108905712 [Anoplophora glabripennis]
MSFQYCLLLVFGLFAAEIYCQGCRLNANRDKYLPLVFHNYTTYFQLVVPEMGEVHLNTGESVTLACTGKKNYLTETNSNSTYATCISGNILRLFRKKIYFDDLRCNKDIRGDIRKTRTICANGWGYITEIGYQIKNNDWFTLIEVCYDDDNGVTFYTAHNLYGNEIKYSARITDRPGFSTDGLGPGIAASLAYTQNFQKSTFSSLLGSARFASYYINRNSYLARGHLSPIADFLLATSKRTTFYLINTTPQWQVINGGNWKSVEASIRKTAEWYNRTFRILTGTYRVLTLPDNKGNLKPIYLVSKDKFPVPREIWKIVYDPETQLGIAIIVINNPFMKKLLKDDILCDNICDQYGWGTVNWNDASRGYTYCCDLSKFIEVVHTTPRLNVRGVLRGIASP